MYAPLIGRAIEEKHLEELFNEDLQCQADHSAWYRLTVCSVKVVARKFVDCNGDSFFICQTSYDNNMECFDKKHVCDSCNRLCSECFKVIPV